MSNSYPYANGAIKSIENKILKPSQIIKLKDVNQEELVKVLYDAGIGMNLDSLESLLKSEEENTKQLLLSITPNKDLTNLFFIENNSLEIKVAYKKLLFSSSTKLNSMTTFCLSIDDIVSSDEKTSDIHLKNIINIINNQIQNSKVNLSAKDLSNLIDKVIYEYALKFSKKSSKQLYNYLISKINFTNILSMLRIVELNWDKSEFDKLFINGGNISKKLFDEVFSQGLKISNNFSNIVVNKFKELENTQLTKVLEEYKQLHDLSILELRFNQMLLDQVALYKNDAFNIGPILYYYLAKVAEIKNIRICCFDKNSSMSDLLNY